jgi:short-subunit dehydrogenase
MTAIIPENGGIDVLVNNAGYAEIGIVEEVR